MTLVDACALVALIGMIAYAIFGGADFGAGIWDLFARGPRRNERRQTITEAIGPVWEANHVWLIFVVVVFFTAFPRAWAAYCTALGTPLRLALLGIALRGVGFVFRTYASPGGRLERRWGYAFGIASLVTPALLGASVGAVSSGRLRVSDDLIQSVGGPAWLSPVSVAMGAAAIALCMHLAAVFLTIESEGALKEDFRRRAIYTWWCVVLGAAITMPLTYVQAPNLWRGLLRPEMIPLLVGGLACGIASLVCLRRRMYLRARFFSSAGVASLLVDWAVAQHPYLIYPDITLASAAAPDSMLRFLLISLPFGLVIIVPSLMLLFRVFKGADARVV